MACLQAVHPKTTESGKRMRTFLRLLLSFAFYGVARQWLVILLPPVLRTPRWRRFSAVLAIAASLAVTGCVIPNYEYGPARQSPVFVLDSSIAPSALTPL